MQTFTAPPTHFRSHHFVWFLGAGLLACILVWSCQVTHNITPQEGSAKECSPWAANIPNLPKDRLIGCFQVRNENNERQTTVLQLEPTGKALQWNPTTNAFDSPLQTPSLPGDRNKTRRLFYFPKQQASLQKVGKQDYTPENVCPAFAQGQWTCEENECLLTLEWRATGQAPSLRDKSQGQHCALQYPSDTSKEQSIEPIPEDGGVEEPPDVEVAPDVEIPPDVEFPPNVEFPPDVEAPPDSVPFPPLQLTVPQETCALQASTSGNVNQIGLDTEASLVTIDPINGSWLFLPRKNGNIRILREKQDQFDTKKGRELRPSDIRPDRCEPLTRILAPHTTQQGTQSSITFIANCVDPKDKVARPMLFSLPYDQNAMEFLVREKEIKMWPLSAKLDLTQGPIQIIHTRIVQQRLFSLFSNHTKDLLSAIWTKTDASQKATQTNLVGLTRPLIAVTLGLDQSFTQPFLLAIQESRPNAGYLFHYLHTDLNTKQQFNLSPCRILLERTGSAFYTDVATPYIGTTFGLTTSNGKVFIFEKDPFQQKDFCSDYHKSFYQLQKEGKKAFSLRAHRLFFSATGTYVFVVGDETPKDGIAPRLLRVWKKTSPQNYQYLFEVQLEQIQNSTSSQERLGMSLSSDCQKVTVSSPETKRTHIVRWKN